MPELSTIQQIAIWIIPVLLAITIHEASHAWVASLCGDRTAEQEGRLSFNPIKHIDLFGTIIVPLMVLILSKFSFVFGWAKPVPITPSRMRNPRRDVALVTLAGPLSNLIMAICWALCFKLSTYLDPQRSSYALFLLLSARAGMIINLLLCFFNLLPIPPMDGSKVVMSLMSPRAAMKYQKLEPYGFFIVLLLLITGALAWILNPLMNYSLRLLVSILNL
ncbi:transmembrane protein [Legionella birminghamensis]|uniref:Transmembrane protein n=1 Tax=Legionella birminghamensis TaxID=28083 RepID=A0A378IAU1_9GAMM|nr:site-2 protease family protein [Legionella birminghamensis]KTC76077.1 transmembrane protein [Legionella birminghamensis]STX32299.1 transmembrane protein [Legionella birminghamensis]